MASSKHGSDGTPSANGRRLRVLQVHNGYTQVGGEEAVLEAERTLLERRGHEVLRLTVSNHSIDRKNLVQSAARTIWSGPSKKILSERISTDRPDLVHVHNTFPLLSPSIYSACNSREVALVQTVHNYRLLCLNGLFLRDGLPCEDCLGTRTFHPGVRHGCYRGSTTSAIVASMLAFNRRKGSYGLVDRYLALTHFAKAKLIEGGIDPELIQVKPNFLLKEPTSVSQDQRGGRGDYLLFVGRLEPEKGLSLLMNAWEQLPEPIPLAIVGDGTGAPEVRSFATRHPEYITWAGRQSPDEVLAWMAGARALVMPSLWYEGLPMTVIEASSCGTASIVPAHGALREVVDDGYTGWHVAPNDHHALARVMSIVWNDSSEAGRRGAQALSKYRYTWTPSVGYENLIAAYEQALRHSAYRRESARADQL